MSRKKIIRTPESRFQNLPDYHFSSNYIEIEKGLRLHYLDEGKKNDPMILLLHGQPSWSYLYRKMIPILSQNNFRVIAPDLIGFGKSDKFTSTEDYSYQKHIDWITTFILKLGLQDITLFCQDWGGLIGLRIATEIPDRFSAIIASNTALPNGKVKVSESFLKWKSFSQKSPEFNIGSVINSGTVQAISQEVIDAYNAPFPAEEYKAGARVFPILVPLHVDNPEAKKNMIAWEKLMKWKKPFLTLFGNCDDITKGTEELMQKLIPGAKGQKHKLLYAGHFIQEEKGEELAKLIVDFRK